MPLLNYNSNSTEQTLYHAQKIIDYFSGNLKTSGCLSSIPITLVAEADHIIDKINGIKDAVDNNTAGLNNNITKIPKRSNSSSYKKSIWKQLSRL